MMSDHSLAGAGSAGASSAYGGLGGGSFSQMAGMGMMGGGLAGLFGNLFGGGNDFQNPSDAASPYFQQIPGALSPYFSPYMHPEIGNQLQGQYGQMANDPTGMLSKIGSQYQQSPGYQWQLNQALQAGNNASAAGGASGTPANQQQQMQMATGMANQNYQQYLQNAMGMMGAGQQGLGDLYKTGAAASGAYGTDLANSLMTQGNLAYQGANAQNVYNQNQDSMWGNLIGMGANIAGWFGG